MAIGSPTSWTSQDHLGAGGLWPSLHSGGFFVHPFSSEALLTREAGSYCFLNTRGFKTPEASTPLLNFSMLSPACLHLLVNQFWRQKHRSNREFLLILTTTAAHTRNSMPWTPSCNFCYILIFPKLIRDFQLAACTESTALPFLKIHEITVSLINKWSLRLDYNTKQNCPHFTDEETDVQRSTQGHRGVERCKHYSLQAHQIKSLSVLFRS